MNLSVILRAVFLVVVIALVAGGVLYWRGIIGHPKQIAAAKAPGAAKAPVAKATPSPAPLPSGAPIIGVDNDPVVIYPFARRLMQVNKLAHKMIVTNAEYHDTDQGQRYFVAVVTSCKDLDKIWSINKGVLEARVEGPLQLKTDFPIFSFVEYFSQGQWGVSSCDGTT